MGYTRLLPFRDERGLWRGSGRLQYVQELKRDAREPILLHKGSHATTLLLRYIHEKLLGHSGGAGHLLSRLQVRFWLPNARAIAFRLLQKCISCRKRLARPRRPPEGPLPILRIPTESTHAFDVTAVDCAGPFMVRRGRAHESHYMLLFTCCQLRAVRIEWLASLGVDSFLLALTRASSRGVNPHTILSDNGGNFESANKLLRALWKSMPQDELEMKKPEIHWRFNPPYASHYGGVFERLIGAAKQALYHSIPAHHTLYLEDLITAFAVVEGVLNSRPLAYVTTDAKDPQALTPNHFLYGAASLPLALPAEGATLARKWDFLRSINTAFLKQFIGLVRPHLQLAHRLRSGGRDLKEGDIVVFFLPSSTRKWPLARVQEVYPGKDGRVRTLLLKVPQLRGESKDYHRSEDKLFKRDVGDVALILPADSEPPIKCV